MACYRVKIRWSGFTGAPGYTILHFDASTTPTQAGGQAAYDAAKAFAEGIASAVPSVVSLTTEGTVEVIDETTNELMSTFAVTQAAANKGVQTSGFSSATGACIVWDTGEVKNGRRVRGRTFVVPITSTYYDTDGTLTAGGQGDIQTAATALAGGGFSFGVLSRPSIAGAADGSFHTVTAGRVNDKTAILRSRRD